MTAPTLLVTRPAEQVAGWVEALRAEGVNAQALPLIGIAPLADMAPVRALWSRLNEWQALVFVSANAVGQFFAQCPAPAAWPAGLVAAAPGRGTAQALRAAGVPAACVVEPVADARSLDSESLWDVLEDRRDWRAARVLILRGADVTDAAPAAGRGREWLARQLTEAGATVQFQAVYQRGPALLDAAQRALLAAALAKPAQHAWLFSSAEAIERLHVLALEAGLSLVPGSMQALVTHPRIAERARAHGWREPRLVAPDPAAIAAALRDMGAQDPSIESFAP